VIQIVMVRQNPQAVAVKTALVAPNSALVGIDALVVCCCTLHGDHLGAVDDPVRPDGSVVDLDAHIVGR